MFLKCDFWLKWDLLYQRWFLKKKFFGPTLFWGANEGLFGANSPKNGKKRSKMATNGQKLALLTRIFLQMLGPSGEYVLRRKKIDPTLFGGGAGPKGPFLGPKKAKNGLKWQ